MKLYVLILGIIVPTCVIAGDWKITEDVQKMCAEQGGCILTIPDGNLVPMQAVKDAMNQAYAAGVEAGRKGSDKEGMACLRKNV